MTAKINLLLECTCITTKVIESVVKRPSIGDEVICPNHKRKTKIKRIGQPYDIKPNIKIDLNEKA